MKRNRTWSVVFAIVFGLLAVGISAAAPGGPPKLAGIVVQPLQSALASPTQLNKCVSIALKRTAELSPDTNNAPVVSVAKQVNDDQYAATAPKVAAKGPKFGTTMNLVYLSGHFRTVNHAGGIEYVDHIMYLMTPDCYVTVMTYAMN
jgi:hypothetical protein